MDTLNTLLGVFMVGEFMERKYGGFALADTSALPCARSPFGYGKELEGQAQLNARYW